MTKTDFAELKEKLTTWDNKNAKKEFKTYEKGLFCIDSFLRAARYQHSQNAKTITALLSIIEDMQNGYRNTRHQIVGFKGNAEILSDIDETLTATEQKLKNLTEEK